MKTLISLTCLTLVACSPGGGYRSRTKAAAAPTKNIAELAIATPQLSTLLAAVKAAGLVDTLAGEGPFTVFAPTNDAFAKIPEETLNGLLADKDALTAVLLRHVVPGAALKARDVPKGTTTVKTAGGEEIDVTVRARVEGGKGDIDKITAILVQGQTSSCSTKLRSQHLLYFKFEKRF